MDNQLYWFQGIPEQEGLYFYCRPNMQILPAHVQMSLEGNMEAWFPQWNNHAEISETWRGMWYGPISEPTTLPIFSIDPK